MQRLPIQDRLIAEANRRKENREKIKKNLEIEEMRECSFQPRLGDYKVLPRYPKVGMPGALHGQVPIHYRIDEMVKTKNDNLHRLRIEHEMAQTELTFQPRVNDKSK